MKVLDEPFDKFLSRFDSNVQLRARKLRYELSTIKKSGDINFEIIKALIKVGDLHDEQDTFGHLKRISFYSRIIAENFGFSEKEVNDVYNAAPLHDIGKIFIPRKILEKPDKLSKEEFEIMKMHTIYGFKILEDLSQVHDIFKIGANIALMHHERYDGNGYPFKYKEEFIPDYVKIVSIADIFDALTSERGYKPPYPEKLVVSIINNMLGTSINPRFSEVFLKIKDILFKPKDSLKK